MRPRSTSSKSALKSRRSLSKRSVICLKRSLTLCTMRSGLKDVVDDIKKLGSGKFFASSSRRRLLSTDHHVAILAAHADYKNRLASAESIVLRELVKLSETIHSPDFATKPRTRATKEASLGKNAFEEVLDAFLDDLEAAIELMADTTSVKAEFSIKASGSASVSAAHGPREGWRVLVRPVFGRQKSSRYRSQACLRCSNTTCRSRCRIT